MNKEKLLLYSPEVSHRLEYIASYLVLDILGAELVFTSDIHVARTTGFPVLNYSSFEIPGAVNIIPHGLLGETVIRPQNTAMTNLNGLPVLFRNRGNNNTGFDIFASSFYILSRYEEYLPFKSDNHGRFPFNQSLGYKYSVAEEPLIELWAIKLKEFIIEKYPGATFTEREFCFIPTIDIDVPWSYRNRSFWRNAGGVIRSFLKADMEDIISRYRVLYNGVRDPYDTFGFINKIHDEYGYSSVYFFSSGKYGKYDKCISSDNDEYRLLISELSKKYKWGIHPSYYSFNNADLMQKEISGLFGITGKSPLRSRQHYLRLEFPCTYRLLSENGILEDYTMGWAENPGFRAGTCTPFKFYDIEKEQATSLKIFPFQIMDGSLCDYLQLMPDQACEYAQRVIKKVKDVNGTLITLWHNQSFSEKGRWKDWKNVYIKVLKAATK